MMDPLAILGTAVKTVQKLREVTQKVKDVETLDLIADLNLSLADLKMQIADLQGENLKLREEVDALARQSSFRGKLEIRNKLYYFKNSEQDRPDGPYCTRCYDVEQKLVLVTSLPTAFLDLGKFTCPNCKATY